MNNRDNINKYIITGGPGSGKSTLLNALSNAGYNCFEEISRIIIQEQHAKGGNKLPWNDLEGFAQICYQRMNIQLDESPNAEICFYDRALPDIIAYMRRGQLPVPKNFYERCTNYNPLVFIAPPWEEIFVNDDERPESYQDSVEIFQFLQNTYKELNFKVIQLPRCSVKSRVDFIHSHINSLSIPKSR